MSCQPTPQQNHHKTRCCVLCSQKLPFGARLASCRRHCLPSKCEIWNAECNWFQIFFCAPHSTGNADISAWDNDKENSCLALPSRHFSCLPIMLFTFHLSFVCLQTLNERDPISFFKARSLIIQVAPQLLDVSWHYHTLNRIEGDTSNMLYGKISSLRNWGCLSIDLISSSV